jgi:hypothetical protein
MRAFLLVALLALSACASGPAPGPRPGRAAATPFPRSHGVTLTAADKADPMAALRRAGAGDAMTPEGARSLFGRADVERLDGAGALLTYRTPTCALVLLFAADRAGDLRLGATEAAARDQRAPTPPFDQCVSEALARGARS